MKKNKMMRLASVLLVLVMLTTCVISGTFAKYVDQGSASDSARVAKWGIVIEVTGDAAFAPGYGADDKASTDLSATATTVLSADSTANVVAPGTKGDLGAAEITGNPEVDYHVAVACDLNLTGWVINSTVSYCPIKFVVNDGSADQEFVFDFSGAVTIDEFEAEIEKAVIAALLANTDAYAVQKHTVAYEGLNPTTEQDGYIAVAQYEANEICNKTVSVTWEWAYSQDSAYQNDTNDTKLGNLPTAPQISFNLAVSATQQD